MTTPSVSDLPRIASGRLASTARLLAGIAVALWPLLAICAAEPPFVRLSPLPRPTIVSAAAEYSTPEGRYQVANLVDGQPETEYAAADKGVGTSVEFDFGKPVTIGAYRHVDRNDVATVTEAELTFLDGDGKSIGKVLIPHVGERLGATTFLLPKPVTARRARWRATKAATEHQCLGGSEITFYSAQEAEASPKGIAIEAWSQPLISRCDGKRQQDFLIKLDSPYATAVDAAVFVDGRKQQDVSLPWGRTWVTAHVDPVGTEKTVTVAVAVAGQTVATHDIRLKPQRKWVIYLLPHSHVDIGYTHVQSEVEALQWRNIDRALDLCAKTADYPPEARFKWNTEVFWAVDSYLRQAPPEKRQRLADAIRAGQVEIDGLYGNELTALCRPEELLRLFDRAVAAGNRLGVTVDSAMISDVPGHTWGIVCAMAQAGVKYFSIGPNWCARIGRTMSEWEDKPFYWLGPDGRNKVLCWIPYRGYAMGFIEGQASSLERFALERPQALEQADYPYDIIQMRWAIGSDNGPPDDSLPDAVRAWNEKYESPKLVIATTGELFRAFEQQYGDKIPVVAGDFTPYWEDGAGSSARETAVSRNAAERLAQAEAITAILCPRQYPARDFSDAWRDVILYNEHTWGAHNSISEPDAPFVQEQWAVKQAFAVDADAKSRDLLSSVLNRRKGNDVAGSVDVFNASAWPRTDLVVLSKEMSAAGDRVTAADGNAVPSQRLSTGELAFLATDVPGLGAKRYGIGSGSPPTSGQAKAENNALGSSAVSLNVDPASGAITSLKSAGLDAELSDMKSDVGLNRYYYVLADRVKEAQQAGPATVKVKESGPLVASLSIESDAPGCTKFSREIRVIDGLDRVDILNIIDKNAVREKEGVHLGFAFNVPEGVMRMDTPWAVVRPEMDQLPGACKNWFTVGRWVDVSNADYGVTWATLDAPLVEVGSMTASIMGEARDPASWLDSIAPSQTFYSWVMNNHWFTNYRADQDGPTTFRYSIRPHASYDPTAAQRFGVECSQPLIAATARGPAPDAGSLLKVENPEIVVASIKPSNDGKALIVRLFGASGKDAKTAILWENVRPQAVWLSNLAEEPCSPATDPIDVPAMGIVTLRADLP